MKFRIQLWLSCLALVAIVAGCAAFGQDSKTGWNGFSPPPGSTETNGLAPLVAGIVGIAASAFHK